ncbi:MAG TPA: PEP-CTERM sorting domain-containing protein [Telluria sp.]|jgi:hypothetical protein
MLKKMICAMALMGSALSSQAAVQGFDWTYTGFLPSYASESSPAPQYGPFNPNHVLQGRFYAEDLDNNGTFSTAEVTSFTIYGKSYMDCTGARRCDLFNLSYTPGSLLQFDAYDSTVSGTWGSGWWETTTRSYLAGASFYTVYENEWSLASTYRYTFTPETKFAISPVPEPQTWLMLGAGMALLGAVKRRRSRNA